MMGIFYLSLEASGNQSPENVTLLVHGVQARSICYGSTHAAAPKEDFALGCRRVVLRPE
jgi:hypothetical protein